jgi:hypothetical protein
MRKGFALLFCFVLFCFVLFVCFFPKTMWLVYSFLFTPPRSIVKEFKSSISKQPEPQQVQQLHQPPARDSKDGRDPPKEKESKSKSKSKATLAGFGMTSDGEGGQGTASTYTLVCRKKIWTKDDQILDSDFVSNILYSQIMEDYLNSNLMSMTELTPEFAEVAAQVAALQMKCGHQVSDHFSINQLVPQVVFQLKDEAWWRAKVMGIFSTLKEQPEIIFKRQILKILQGLPLFGSTLFTVKVSQTLPKNKINK